MTIEQAEAELIRVLDAKVAAGAKLEVMRGRSGARCGCALQVYTGESSAWYEAARDAFQWSGDAVMAFAIGFDGKFRNSERYPHHAALGDRIARRYGVR